MAIDTPATIAIIGAGPVGLEAALYARYLGYDVLLFDRGPIAANVARWSHTRMVTPFGACSSKLGLAALHAQDPRWRPPAAAALLTGAEWRASYLLPLAQSDLLVDTLREQSEIVAVERLAETNSEPASNDVANDAEDDRDETEGPDEPPPPAYVLRVRRPGGKELESCCAHVVIDASGAMNVPGWLSGGPESAPGELTAAAQVVYGLPDVFGRDRGDYGRSYEVLAADFYCIGAKSFAPDRATEFSFASGLEQIRQLFAMLMDRAALDLYATMDKLLP